MTMPTGEFGVDAAVTVQEDRIVVSGSFRLPARDGHGQPDHAALVMTVSYRTGHKIIRPFKDKVPFADDLMVSEHSVAGRFEVDFREHLVDGISTYHVLFSIRDQLSPVLEINVPD